MKIENAQVVEDILSIIEQGSTYTDRSTGSTRTAVPFSDIVPSLLGGMNGNFRPESGRRWKNISYINEGDLEDSGFTLIRHTDNPNGGFKGGWVDFRGRKVAKWTTLVTF